MQEPSKCSSFPRLLLCRPLRTNTPVDELDCLVPISSSWFFGGPRNFLHWREGASHGKFPVTALGHPLNEMFRRRTGPMVFNLWQMSHDSGRRRDGKQGSSQAACRNRNCAQRACKERGASAICGRDLV